MVFGGVGDGKERLEQVCNLILSFFFLGAVSEMDRNLQTRLGCEDHACRWGGRSGKGASVLRPSALGRLKILHLTSLLGGRTPAFLEFWGFRSLGGRS